MPGLSGFLEVHAGNESGLRFYGYIVQLPRPMAARPLKSTRPMAALLEVAQTADSPV